MVRASVWCHVWKLIFGSISIPRLRYFSFVKRSGVLKTTSEYFVFFHSFYIMQHFFFWRYVLFYFRAKKRKLPLLMTVNLDGKCLLINSIWIANFEENWQLFWVCKTCFDRPSIIISCKCSLQCEFELYLSYKFEIYVNATMLLE